MIYLLKFGASLILPPGIFFVLFLLLAIYCWKYTKKYVAIIILILTMSLYLLSTSWMSQKLVSNLENEYNLHQLDRALMLRLSDLSIHLFAADKEAHRQRPWLYVMSY